MLADIPQGSRVTLSRPRTGCSAGVGEGLFRLPLRVTERKPRRAKGLLLLLLGAFLVLLELQTSWLQSRLFSAVARQLTFSLEPGPNPNFRYPHSGPYDLRLGHSLLGEFSSRLKRAGYRIEAQARPSETMTRLLDWGFFPAYREKPQAGLRIRDRHGRRLYQRLYPERVYRSFEAIPALVVQSLLFIENRELLDTSHPYRNPAIEWDRFAKAALDLGISKVYGAHPLSGGSTLATQLEKLRHSPGGVTGSMDEKFRQMFSASLRAYQDGISTVEARRRIVCDYLNSIPLAAVPGYGEVYGLGDGLWAWFGADFEAVNRLLREPEQGAPDELLERKAEAYRQVLTLLLAVKKPSGFLVQNPEALGTRVDRYLRLLANEGVISAELRDRALALRPALRDRVPPLREDDFAQTKATDSVRVELLRLLGLPSVYELDRLDLTVESTLDAAAQAEVSEFLAKLKDARFAAEAGLTGYRLLESGDPSGVIYSVTIYERGPGANLLRVQADNYNQPLNINEGTKLELGSTAKLRTLISYLEAVQELHGRFANLSPSRLDAVPVAPEDKLTRWALDYLRGAQDRSLPAMLEAAMTRTYSASPGEAFFTGGGLHTFSNFDAADNGRVLTVREAFQRSVNLVFIRLMRDLVNYHIYRLPGVTPDLITDIRHPGRRDYLIRFAKRDGRQYLTRFYQKYEGLAIDEALRRIAGSIHRTPKRLAVIYRSVRPQDGVDALAAYLIGILLDPNLPDSLIEGLFREYAPERFSLADRAHLAGVHPLELWLLEYKSRHPHAQLGEIFRASEPYCREAYSWLFRDRHKRAQDRAIRVMLEIDAFRSIHQGWQRQGYPFSRLVPSLATALGSSGDTPAALAELMGVIAAEGVHYPTVRVSRLRLAEATPFETHWAKPAAPGRRVLSREIVAVLRRELVGVVEQGTARRAAGGLVLADGTRLPVGGKTGTGDNRFQVSGPGGRVIESRAVNRTATFVFLIGDRIFGTVTAFVPGESAQSYSFTSSLPVQMFKELGSVFASLLSEDPQGDTPHPGAQWRLARSFTAGPAPSAQPTP